MGKEKYTPNGARFFVRKKYTAFSTVRIIALRSVNKTFTESYDFAAIWIQEVKPLFNSMKILIIVFEFAIHSLELEIKFKKNYFRPTYPIFSHKVSGNTTFFFLYGLMRKRGSELWTKLVFIIKFEDYKTLFMVFYYC
jgi:hypothetical protein